jgi:hypothetical protein
LGGGGIHNSSTLTISHSSLCQHHASEGGGITYLGTVSVSNCTLTGNTA